MGDDPRNPELPEPDVQEIMGEAGRDHKMGRYIYDCKYAVDPIQG